MNRKHFGCSIQGCEGKHFGRGMCKVHHRRWYFDSHGQSPNYLINDLKFKRSNKGLFGLLKRGAKIRGFSVDITLERFSKLRELPCFYCGGNLSEGGHSMDRKNNTLGYTEENTVPCCYSCNHTKSDTLSSEEMINVISFRREGDLAERMLSSC